MEVNLRNLANTLKNAKLSFKRQRPWDKPYNEKTSDYWNTLIWSTILKNRNISGTTVDKYELIDMFSNYLKRDEIIDLFSIINTKLRSISQGEFTDFLEHIDEPSYITLVNSAGEIQTLTIGQELGKIKLIDLRLTEAIFKKEDEKYLIINFNNQIKETDDY